MLRPRASSPSLVAGPSATTWPLSTFSPLLDDGPLRVAGILVGALVLHEDVLVARLLVGVGLDQDVAGVDVVHDAVAARLEQDARVVGALLLHAGAYPRRLGEDERHGLALHVRAHEGAVGVVVLEEGHERRGYRDDLLGRDVHVLELVGAAGGVVALVPARDRILQEIARLVDLGARLGDVVLVLVHGGEVLDLLGGLALLDLAERSLEEAVLVHRRIGREADDEADVRAFRRLDGAHPAVVRVMDVADLEARAVARKAARTQGVQPPLVRELGERVYLVHELGELGGAEELLDRGDDGLDGDEVLGADRVRLLEAHALLGDALHAAEGALHHVGEELADRAHAAVAEVVDIVDVRGAVVHVHQVLHRRDDVRANEGELLHRHRVVELLVELVAADLAEVVTPAREEHVLDRARRSRR